MKVRTRFAPSPTGYLHIGGVRTALYSWLFARKHQGVFILRIEDTDRERSTQASIDAILEGMAWLGLNADEEVYYQTKRFSRYREVLDELLQTGKAYRCYCSRERLETLRDDQIERKLKPRYDGHCRDLNLPANDAYVIRFRNPLEGAVSFYDHVKGQMTFQNNELDDLIIQRNDGTPTYNFSVVVDDLDMDITHVIRGDDHLNNTPRQINILLALGAQIPEYAHLPMILGPDGKRLSKRHGAVGIGQYRDDGYLPEALLNYLVRLGWSKGDQEIFTQKEMITHFEIAGLNNSPAAFNPEKLLWLNQHYIKTLPLKAVTTHLAYQMQRLNITTNNGPTLTTVLEALRERSKTLREMAEKSRCFYEDFSEYDLQAVETHLKPEILPVLNALKADFNKLDQEAWDAVSLHEIIKQNAEQFDVKLGQIAQPLRIALCGSTVSPPIDVTLALMGKDNVLERLQRMINQFFK